MRRRATWSITAAVAVALMGGCEKAQTRKAIVLAPTTRQAPVTPPVKPPVATADPVKRPSTTQVARKSVIFVDGQPYEFPAAKLVLHKEGDKLRAMLCSNDPPEVISPAYQGNRYSFEMMVNSAEKVDDLSAEKFEYRAASQEPQETTNGIFLEGDREHLQPYQILVVFDKQEDHWVAQITGTFLRVTKGNRFEGTVRVIANLAVNPEKR
jgi:hypothetical protein